jgi:hypothetical protein
VRRRFAPHQLRHAHAVEMAREGVPLNVIQRQLGHANLGITSVYLEGSDNAGIIDTVQARREPMIPASAACAPALSTASSGRLPATAQVSGNRSQRARNSARPRRTFKCGARVVDAVEDRARSPPRRDRSGAA